MCPTRAQSIQRERATLLSTEYTSRFGMPSVAFRQSASRPTPITRSSDGVPRPGTPQAPAPRIWNYAEQSPREIGGRQSFNRNRSA